MKNLRATRFVICEDALNGRTLLEAAPRNIFHILVVAPRPGVALVVEAERDDVVEPVRRQVQEVAGRQDHFVGLHLGELGPFLQVRVRPVDAVGGVFAGGVEVARVATVPPRRMAHWQEVPMRQRCKHLQGHNVNISIVFVVKENASLVTHMYSHWFGCVRM